MAGCVTPASAEIKSGPQCSAGFGPQGTETKFGCLRFSYPWACDVFFSTPVASVYLVAVSEPLQARTHAHAHTRSYLFGVKVKRLAPWLLSMLFYVMVLCFFFFFSLAVLVFFIRFLLFLYKCAHNACWQQCQLKVFKKETTNISECYIYSVSPCREQTIKQCCCWFTWSSKCISLQMSYKSVIIARFSACQLLWCHWPCPLLSLAIKPHPLSRACWRNEQLPFLCFDAKLTGVTLIYLEVWNFDPSFSLSLSPSPQASSLQTLGAVISQHPVTWLMLSRGDSCWTADTILGELAILLQVK